MERVTGRNSLFKGMGGHHSALSQSVDWLTPPEIVRALGPFDTDPAASCSQVHPLDQCFPKFPPCAREAWCACENGFSKKWSGRVWLNPPYDAGIGLWMRKLARHGDGIALVFARTETEWFQAHVFGFPTGIPKADGLLFLKGRLTFKRPDGAVARYTSGAPSVLIAYGLENLHRLRHLKMDGALIELAQGRHA